VVVVDEVVEEYLRRGDFHKGFARLRGTNHKLRHYSLPPEKWRYLTDPDPWRGRPFSRDIVFESSTFGDWFFPSIRQLSACRFKSNFI
jgi:hypothetical protein